MRAARRIVALAGAIGLLTGTSGPAAAPAEPTLEARAVLPATTFAAGPRSGAALGPGPFNGVPAPFASQPVEGFSGLLSAGGGEFFAIADNGYGAKENSADFLLRIYRLAPRWETAAGGPGSIDVQSFVQLRDPNRRVPWAIVNGGTPDRLLTGGDFDPESFEPDGRGGFWIGEEFGPFLLHVDGAGRLLDAPISLPGVRSPQNPTVPGSGAPTLPTSGGFKGLGRSADGRRLYPMLARALSADVDPRRHFIYEFDVAKRRYTGRTFRYHTEAAANSVEDLVPFGPNELLAIERDDTQGAGAKFKRVFAIDLERVDSSGFLVKRPVLDLLHILDPASISLPARAGDIGLGNPFSMPFVSPEAVWTLGTTRLVLVNDNNFPFSAARNPGRPDDNEFVIVGIPPVRLPPAEGTVQRAWMSLAGRSAAVTRVRATASLQANFLFRAQPRAGSRLRVDWFYQGRRSLTIPKPRSQLVTSFIFSKPRLGSGAYRAVLYVQPPGAKRRAVASARARIG